MKFTSLWTVTSVVLSGAAMIVIAEVSKNQAEYTPRIKRLSEGFEGAVEVNRMLRANIETGRFEPGDYEDLARSVNEFDRAHAGERSIDMAWWEVGPNNIGGRTRAILAVDNNLLFCGSVTGGLYKSVNAGNNWTRVESLDAFGKTMAISCIAQTGDGSIYIGTGSTFEQNFGGDGQSASIGVGLYRSTDLGATWTLVPGTEPAAFTSNQGWAYINDIEADPNVPTRLWIAGNAGSGFYDAASGQLQTNLSGIPVSTGHDIAWAKDGSYVLIGINNGRVYKSTNGGSSFVQVGTGQLQNRQRVRIAISPDDVTKAYVLYAQGGFMGGLYYTPNSGDSWELKWPSGQDNVFSVFGSNGQAFYDLALCVKPGEPGVCWVGGVTLWQAGANTQPEQMAFNFSFGGSELYVHSDIHDFEFAPNGDWYIATDGGVFKSVNKGQTFTEVNRGFVTTQFYAIGVSAGYPAVGGTQDNGTILIPGMEWGPVQTDSWQQGISIQGGDGFHCDLSNITVPGNEVAFATSQYGVLSRYNAQGAGGGFYDNNITSLINNQNEIGPFYTVMRLYENTDDENSQQRVILFNNRNYDLYSYEENGETVWFDTTLFTQNMTLPFNYRFPLGDTLHFWPTLVRPEIWSTQPITSDPNYPWLAPQTLTSTVDSCITTEMLVGFETVIDQIIEETIWIFWEDSIYVPEIDDYYYYNDSALIVIGTDTTYIDLPIYEYTTVCTTWYYYASDVLNNVREQWLVQDRFTSMLVVGFTGNQGIWLTRQALNFNVSPQWWKINNAPVSSVRKFEFTRDGKTLFYSSWAGQLFRVSNLDQLWSSADVSNLQITQIASNAGSAITSIASDPNNPNHLVYTVGGYGQLSGGKVRETFNALATTPSFVNRWNWSGANSVLERMPVFASVIDVTDPTGSTIIIGTEFGIWGTSNGGQSWVHHATSADVIPSVPQAGPSTGTLRFAPVYDLRQQQNGIRPYMNPTNYGVIYAGTHGRGIWRSDASYTVNVEEVELPVNSQNSLLVFPNPTVLEAYLQLDLSQPVSDGMIRIYSINGQMVNQIRTGQLSRGMNRISLEAERLSSGTYIVNVDAGEASGTTRFVKR